MPIGPKRMPFFEHLAELRWRLAIIAGVLIGLTLVLYFFTPQIFSLLVAPVAFMFKDSKAITLSPLEPMTLRFKLALWSSVVIGSPIIIWQILAFFLPALKPNERRWFVPTFAAAVALFALGVVFCYEIVLHASMLWLVQQAGGMFTFLPKGADVLTVVTFFLVGFGVAFETPIVVFYLVYFGVIPYAKLRANWRVVYVVIATLAAMITPDWSPVSMGALALAMVALYEISMGAVRVVLARKISRQLAADED